MAPSAEGYNEFYQSGIDSYSNRLLTQLTRSRNHSTIPDVSRIPTLPLPSFRSVISSRTRHLVFLDNNGNKVDKVVENIEHPLR